MTPAVECGVVLDWLEGIDERLPAFVEQKFANELQSVTITDIQVEISKHIYLFIYLIIYKVHLNAPRVVKVHHKEHQVNEPLARLL